MKGDVVMVVVTVAVPEVVTEVVTLEVWVVVGDVATHSRNTPVWYWSSAALRLYVSSLQESKLGLIMNPDSVQLYRPAVGLNVSF